MKQGTQWGRSVWLSTAPATDFGAFTKPELIFHADEQDQINGRGRVCKSSAQYFTSHLPTHTTEKHPWCR